MASAIDQFQQKSIDAQRGRDAIDLEMWAFETVGNARTQMSQLNDPAAIAELSASTSDTIAQRFRSIDDPQLRDRVQRSFMQQASAFRVEAVQRQAKAENIQSLAAIQRFGDTLSQNIGDGAIDFDQAIDIFTESVDELFAAGTINEMAREELLTSTRSNLAARHVTRLIVDELPGEALNQLQDAGVRAALSAAQLSSLTGAARSEQVRQVMESINQQVYDGGIEAILEQIDSLLEEGAIPAGTALSLRGMVEQAERQQAAVMQQAIERGVYELLESRSFSEAATLADTLDSAQDRRRVRAIVASDAAEYTNKQLDVVASDLRQRIAVATDASQIVGAFAAMNEASEQILSVMPESMQDGIRRTMREQHAQMVKDAATTIGTKDDVGMAMAVKASLEQFPDMATPESVRAAQQAVDETTRRAEANDRARTQATMHLQEMAATGRLSRDRVYTQSVVDAMDQQATIAGTRDQLLRELSNISGAPMPASFRRAVTDAYRSSNVSEILRLSEITGSRTVRLAARASGAQNAFMDGMMRLQDTAMPDVVSQFQDAAMILSPAAIQEAAQQATREWRSLDKDSKRRSALGLGRWADMTPSQNAAMREAFIVGRALGLEPSDVFHRMYSPITNRDPLINLDIREPPINLSRLFGVIQSYVPNNLTITDAARQSLHAAARMNPNASPGDSVALPGGGAAIPIYGENGSPIGFTIINENGAIEFGTVPAQRGDARFNEAMRALTRTSDPDIRNTDPFFSQYRGDGAASFLEAEGQQAAIELRDAALRMLERRGFRPLGTTLPPNEQQILLETMTEMANDAGYVGFR